MRYLLGLGLAAGWLGEAPAQVAGLAPKTEEPPAAWVYEASGTPVEGARDGEARAIPKGSTGESNVFEWNLFSLPPGEYRIKGRFRFPRTPTSGELTVAVSIDRRGSGQENERVEAAKISASEAGGEWIECSGDFTLSGGWPYTYLFVSLVNSSEASGEPVEALMDWIEIERAAPAEAPPSGAAGEPLVRVEEESGTRNPEELRVFLETRGVFGLDPGRYEVAMGVAWAGDELADAKEPNVVEKRFRVVMQGESQAGEDGSTKIVGGGLDTWSSLLPSSFRSNRVETIRFPVNLEGLSGPARLTAGYADGSLPEIDVRWVEIRPLSSSTASAR